MTINIQGSCKSCSKDHSQKQGRDLWDFDLTTDKSSDDVGYKHKLKWVEISDD